MRKLILVLGIVGVLAALVYAEQSYEPFGEAWGYGSEEAGTGSYLGVDINEITSDRVSALKLKEERGVEVTMVDQDAPAGKAGVKEHDVILALNGTPVESGAQLRRLIRETPPGRIVTLNISRDGQPLSMKVQLADRRKSMAWSSNNKDFKIAMPPIPPVPEFDVPVSVVVVHSSMRSGLAVENITPQLGEFFGVKSGNGVLIRSVEKGSRAEKAGFRAGDVVVKVNEQPVHDASDFTHALRSKDGNAVTVGIVREKKEQTLTLTLPERKESGELIQEDFDFNALDDLEIPDVDANLEGNLADIQAQIAKLQPQIELAVRESNKQTKECLQQQMEELKREMTERSQELREQMRDEQEQMREQEREQQEQLRDRQREQQEQLREQEQEQQEQLREQQQDEIDNQQELLQEQPFGGQLPI